MLLKVVAIFTKPDKYKTIKDFNFIIFANLKIKYTKNINRKRSGEHVNGLTSGNLHEICFYYVKVNNLLI